MEKLKWHGFRRNMLVAEMKHLDRMRAPDCAPYTSAEKAWLKKAYGGEWHSLRVFQLSIYDEEDREEGRRIVRACIEEDAELDL